MVRRRIEKKKGEKREKKATARIPLTVFFEKKMEREIKSIEHELDATMHHAHFALRVLSLLLLLLASNLVVLFSVEQLDESVFVLAIVLNVVVILAGFWLCLLGGLWISKTILFASLCIVEGVLYYAKISAHLPRAEAVGVFIAINLLVLAYLVKVED